ncbi:MAG: acyl-CoA dehydrogenase family protein, partial [Betaproteobacteria bacterium]
MDFELTAEQIELRDHVAAFAREEVAPVAEQLDRDCRFPTDLYRKAGALGITAIPFDAEFGGMGLGTFEMTLAVEQLARADQSLAVTAMVSVAAGLIVQRFGTAAQKARFLPAIVRGEAIGALAGTEPDAGSDTAGFKTRATRKGQAWVLNGQKAFITNAGTDISTFALTLALTSAAEGPRNEFTLFLVPREAAGYTQGEPYRK